MNRCIRSFLLIVLFLIYSQQSFAFKFNPMTQEISLSQKQNRAVYTIDNDSDKPIAIEISVRKRVMKEDGSEDHLVVGNFEISVFPEQMIIPAKDKRTIRVTWNSKKNLSKEEAYRVIAEQLPVNLEGEEKEAGIKMLLRYVAALYINPGKTKSDLKIDSFKVMNDVVEFRFHNAGTKHHILNDFEIKLEKGDQSIILEEADLKKIWGENVLAQSSRIFRFERNKKIKNINSDYTASLIFND